MNARPVAALISSIVFVACGSPADLDEDTVVSTRIDVVVEKSRFASEEIQVDRSESIEIALNNSDSTTHSFTIDEIDLDIEAPGGEVATGTFAAPDENSSLVFYCRFHPAAMKGLVRVGTGSAPEAGSDDGTGEGVNENDDGIDY